MRQLEPISVIVSFAIAALICLLLFHAFGHILHPAQLFGNVQGGYNGLHRCVGRVEIKVVIDAGPSVQEKLYNVVVAGIRVPTKWGHPLSLLKGRSNIWIGTSLEKCPGNVYRLTGRVDGAQVKASFPLLGPCVGQILPVPVQEFSDSVRLASRAGKEIFIR